LQVLRLKSPEDVVLRDPEGGHLGPRHLDVDRLRIVPPEDDPLDILHEQELPSEELRVLVQLGHRVAFARENGVHPVHVAEVVIDDRWAGSGR
jgi:hypothetical protein